MTTEPRRRAGEADLSKEAIGKRPLPWNTAGTHPDTPGWYAVRIRLSDRPAILWWSANSTKWLYGAAHVHVDAWLGPL